MRACTLTICGADGEPDGEDDREKVMGMGEIVGRCVSPVCVSVPVCLSVCQCSVCVCVCGGGGGQLSQRPVWTDSLWCALSLFFLCCIEFPLTCFFNHRVFRYFSPGGGRGGAFIKPAACPDFPDTDAAIPSR